MISAGKRKPRYGSGVVLMSGTLPCRSGLRQPDNAPMTPLGLQPYPGQAGELSGGEEGAYPWGRAPPAQGAQQPGREFTPADPAARTPDEALQVTPPGA